MILGYARCSLNETRQDISRQKRELHTLGVKEDKHIYWEYESGVKDDRAELQKLLDTVKEGDTIITTEVSRLESIKINNNMYAENLYFITIPFLHINILFFYAQSQVLYA